MPLIAENRNIIILKLYLFYARMMLMMTDEWIILNKFILRNFNFLNIFYFDNKLSFGNVTGRCKLYFLKFLHHFSLFLKRYVL